MKLTLAEVATLINADIVGDPEQTISGLATLLQAGEGEVSFFHNRKYKPQLLETKASAVIIAKQDQALCPVTAIVVDDPYYAYAVLAKQFDYEDQAFRGVHASVVMGKDCDIAKDVTLSPNVVLGDHVKIDAGTVVGANTTIGSHASLGQHCSIAANVSIYHHCIIGNNVAIDSGAAIGSDGFGNALHQGAWHKVPQLGRVVIDDGAEIGANTTIDRGALGDTKIGKGVKLDNLIQIGHNVEIGDHTVIAACAGIAGSTKIGKYCMIGGHSSINGHIEIVDQTMITGQAMISRSIKKPDIYSSGTGMMNIRIWRKSIVRYKQLDNMARRIKALEKALEREKS